MNPDLERRIQDAVSGAVLLLEQNDLTGADAALLERAALAAEDLQRLLERMIDAG